MVVSEKTVLADAFGDVYRQFRVFRWLVRLVEMQNTCLRGQKR